MKFGVPWSVKGLRPETREKAKEAARRSGMPLGEWLNSVILHQAVKDGVPSPSLAYDDDDDDAASHELATVHQRLDDLTRRIDQFTRSGPAAYAPKRSRNDGDQIGRLDRRLDQFVNTAPAMGPPIPAPADVPSLPLPPGLDRAVAEIAARQRALNGQQSLGEAAPALPQTTVATPAPSPVLAPVPTQDLSGLEDQLRKITNQIETLRRPGVEEAINALRAELGEIARALTEAMPRQAIDTIEKQIQGLTQRIAEGRQSGNIAGGDGGALSGVEHGLAEVRDALRGLTPAENLVGFNEAVVNLAHKIDLIVAQKDPATLQQLDHAITTLRDMAAHVASTDAVSVLAEQVRALGEKVDHLAMAGAGSDALNALAHRIAALSDALSERAQSGGTVPPMLESLVQSLSNKIELLQQSRGDNVASGHLEDRIVSLVERLDASDSRLGHLEAIERGLADLLVHIEDIRANKEGGALRAENSTGVDALKHEIDRTRDALEAVNGTLGHVVDRLVMIERDIRGEARPRVVTDEEAAALRQPAGKVAVRVISDALPQAPAPAATEPQTAPPPAVAPKHLPPAGSLSINPVLPPDQPLEPGSGPPHLRANPAARIATSELALGGAGTAAAAGGKSSFIAAARRAAQAAVKAPSDRAPRVEPHEIDEGGPSSLHNKMMKRVKSLFIAASIVAVAIGSIQIAGTVFDFGKPDGSNVKTVESPNIGLGNSDNAAADVTLDAPASLAENRLDPLNAPGFLPIAPLSGSNILASNMRPLDLDAGTQSGPSLLSPPLLESKSDVTGSISQPGSNSQLARVPVQPQPASAQNSDRLPSAIGGARLRSAAVAGDGAAAYEVAVRFVEGRGVPVNLEDAAFWFERAASKGLAPAQFRYASLLEKGQGVRKDLVQARRLYLAAASKGNGKAMHNLAVLYAEGAEGKPDYATAAQWFRKAAVRGIADSQYNLGVLCARGLGTEKSVDESYKWFALAAAQGDRESAKKRDEVADHLDEAALAAAQHAVKSFVAEPQPEDATVVPAPAGGWDNAPGAAPRPAKPRAVGPLSLGSFEMGNR